MKNNCIEHHLPNSNHDLTRREFVEHLVKTVAYTSGIASGISLWNSCATHTTKKSSSLVSIVRSNKVWVDERLHKATIGELLNHGIRNLTGHSDVSKAWHSLFSPHDRVAIKINCIGKGIGSTKPELSYALAECLNNHVNIPFEHITFFDRIEHELIDAGYTLNQSNKGIKVMTTFSNPFSSEMRSGEIETPLTSIITDKCTALINLSLLKTHSGAGISLSFKNHYGSIPKEIVQDGKRGYHGRNYRNLIYLNSLPPIKDKTRLCIIDGLIGQYNLGPEGNPHYQWNYNGVIMGVDPVAVDTIGLTLINEKRKENNLHLLKIPYLKWAEEEGLGITTSELIEIKHIIV